MNGAGHGAADRQRPRANRHTGEALLIAVAIVLSVAVIAVQATSGAASAHPSPGAHPSVARPSVRLGLAPLVPARIVVPGSLAALPFPASGQAAVLVGGVGLVAASADEAPAPIASMTKMMTALIYLRDHPLAPGAPGPSVTMTTADAVAYVHDSEAGDSVLDVAAGEVLNERQLLEGLLLPSADNIADYLAVRDAGSLGAFVAKMNAEAAVLGLTHTHYADASGLDPSSESTAADQAVVASLVAANPTLAGIVSEHTARLPVSGLIGNYNPVLGEDGIVGVKSGFTSEAAACLAIAAQRVVGGHLVRVIVVSTGQPGGLAGAGESDLELLNAVTSSLETFRVLAPGEQLAAVRAPWSKRRVVARAPAAPTTVVAWPGLVLSAKLTPRAPLRTARALRAGEVVGSVGIVAPLGTVASVPLVLSRTLPAVPPGWDPTGT